jgi:hypothetical protein
MVGGAQLLLGLNGCASMKNLSIDDVVAQLNAAVIRAGGIADWAKGIEAPSVVKSVLHRRFAADSTNSPSARAATCCHLQTCDAEERKEPAIKALELIEIASQRRSD